MTNLDKTPSAGQQARTDAPRIALTGGPGGGKTTAADLFRRELGETVVVVPEAASLLFNGGYPRYREAGAVRATQEAIYHVQLGLEYTQAAQYPERVLLCDRGTLDGAAHWPDGVDGFLDAMTTTISAEYRRYDAVVFFESAAVGGLEIEGGNPARIETIQQAAALDRKLRDLWRDHPHFVHVPNNSSFLKKIGIGLDALKQVIGELSQKQDGQ